MHPHIRDGKGSEGGGVLGICGLETKMQWDPGDSNSKSSSIRCGYLSRQQICIPQRLIKEKKTLSAVSTWPNEKQTDSLTNYSNNWVSKIILFFSPFPFIRLNPRRKEQLCITDPPQCSLVMPFARADSPHLWDLHCQLRLYWDFQMDLLCKKNFINAINRCQYK